MTINLKKPDIAELKPRITVFGVGGGGGNAVNNMINAGLMGVDFVVANTDAQALMMSKSERIIQLGAAVTEGLGAGSHPEVGRAAAEECLDEIVDYLSNTHMCFVTAGMGGGTGTGAAPVVARAAREKGILTVGVVTKPFQFEGQRRMKTAEAGIEELQKSVDTLIVIPNQNLFRIANEKTTFADAFAMADQVLYSGVACITDLMVKEGLINLDFADVRSVMQEMGKAMMGTGEASGEGRAVKAAEAAISNPLLDETSMQGARGLLISITGGRDITLFEVDEAATRIREEVDPDANIILGATHDEGLDGVIRVSVVATGIDHSLIETEAPKLTTINEVRGQAPMDNSYISFKRSVDPVKKTVMQRVDASGDELLTMERFDEILGETNVLSPRSSTMNHVYPASSFRAGVSEKDTSTSAIASPNKLAGNTFVRGGEPTRGEPTRYKETMTQNSETFLYKNKNTSLGTAGPQKQVKNLAQELSEIQEFPAIIQNSKSDPLSAPKTDLSPLVLKTRASLDEETAGPRKLWQRIAFGLKGNRRSQDSLAKLEPAELLEKHIESYAEINSKKQEEIRYTTPKTEETRKLEEDDLEIPAFLRQQAN